MLTKETDKQKESIFVTQPRYSFFLLLILFLSQLQDLRINYCDICFVQTTDPQPASPSA
jgi:hypothetical protein